MLLKERTYLIIQVPVDRYIKRYIREFYDGNYSVLYKSIQLEDVVHNGHYGIGGVDIDLRITDDEVIMEFVCVTSDMSRLFTDSPNIRAWFVELCRSAKARLGFYFQDYDNDELFWFHGRMISMRFDAGIEPQNSWPLYEEFYQAVFDNLYYVKNPEP